MDGNDWQVLHQTCLLRLELDGDEEVLIASHQGLMAANRRRLADSQKSIVASWSSIEETHVLLNQSLAAIHRTLNLIGRKVPAPFADRNDTNLVRVLPAQTVKSPGENGTGSKKAFSS